MEKITQYIRNVALSEGEPPAAHRPAMAILSGLAAIYGGVQKIRGDVYGKGWWPIRRLGCAVISIGNLAAGGTGKTPMTDYVARLCRRMGYEVAVLSRGYRGQAERIGGVVSDGHALLMTPEMAGDEPFMLASGLPGIPVIVGRDRFRSGCLAIDRFGPDIIILDDGFQHLQLERDLDILLLDGRRPFGNGHLLPRGVLREPLSAIHRADAVVLTRIDNKSESSASDKGYFAGKPVFRSSHRPQIEGVLVAGRDSHPLGSNEPHLVGSGDPFDPGGLHHRRIFAFSGIARNDSFHRSIDGLGGNMVGHRDFPDHFAYQHGDFTDIGRAALEAGADCMATTAKDYVRIGNRISFPLDLVVVNVRMAFVDDRFDTFLADRLMRIVRSKKNRSKKNRFKKNGSKKNRS